jgi:N-[(2S)-2-amino-2-carboxyethyl]-L-glutamate dehydrogenase
MSDRGILILEDQEIRCLLKGRELDLIDTVRRAYQAHARGDSSLPFSSFLRFPDNDRNRIIALPVYLGGEFNKAGLKWIASFPGNRTQGMDRASAVIILNSVETGRPEAMLEGSTISARRTAASAALAAKHFHDDERLNTVGLIGCGLINFEIAKFLLAIWPRIERFVVYDLLEDAAKEFKQKCAKLSDRIEVVISSSIKTVLKNAPLISVATVASNPHIVDLADCSLGSTILNISLRDLAPGVILACDNVVDDVDHVCREQTSIHLTEQLVGNRDFIRCTLGEILNGEAPARRDPNDIVVFSPFGLGVLDIAVASFVADRATAEKRGIRVDSFLPERWTSGS